jgi:hypothetical protein
MGENSAINLLISAYFQSRSRINTKWCNDQITSLYPYICTTMDIIRSWREQKILLKRKFPILSDDDFLFEDGKRETMLQKLEEKLGMSKPELTLIFEEIQRS